MKSALIKLALVTSTALTFAAPAMAQSADGDIVVTARRIEEKLQDVPISITVFNQQALADRNVTNAQDLAAYTPSLSVTTGFGTENTTYALRGFVQETGTAPSVGVYFGEVVAPRGPSQGFPAGDGAGPGMFFDLQNVQVLKGPQGTLFGRNTTGGAVLLVPQKPTEKLEGYLEGSVGNLNMHRVQGVLNVPLADTLRFRVGADWQQRDGFMKNATSIGPKDFDNINYLALRASLVWDVTPDVENYTIASYINSSNNGHLAKVVAGVPSLDPFGGLLAYQALGNIANQDSKGFYSVTNDMPDAYQKMRTWQVINNTKWRVSDNLTIHNILSYAQLWSKTHTSLFGTQFFMPQGAICQGQPACGGALLPVATTPFNFAVIRNLPNGYSSNQSTFTEEFRLEGNTSDGKLNYQVGVYYEDSKPRSLIGSQSATLIGCSNPDAFVCTAAIPGAAGMNYTAAKNWFRSTGIFAQATYALTEQVKLTGGIRYTWDHVRSFSQRITYAFPPFVPNATPLLPIVQYSPAVANSIGFLSHCTDFTVRVAPACELDEQKSYSAPTWLLGIDYKPSENILTYAKYMRGYRTGNIKSDVPIEFHIFEPEKVDSYELGLKTSFDGALRGTFNIAGFYNSFSNQQLQQGFNINNNRRDPVTGAPLPTISVPGNAGPVNVGKSRIWGIELDTTLHLFEGFTLNAGYTYLNTKIVKITPATLPSDNVYIVNPSAAVGDPLILSPEHKFSVTGTYKLPLAESVGDVSVAATVSYQSSQYTNYTTLRNPTIVSKTGGFDTGRLPGRALLDLNLNWNKVGGGPVDFAIFATNVTGKKYYSSINGLIAGLGIETATAGEPRIFGARVKIHFGD